MKLEFLRYFYYRASEGMGPSSDDIYDIIKEDWIDLGNELPIEYRKEIDE